MQLEETSVPFTPAADMRVRMPEPLPVRLVAVSDVDLPSVAGLEAELDRFYCGLLGMEREPGADGIVYRAENFRLRFAVHERPQPRGSFRAQGIEVPSISDIVICLNGREIEFLQQRGLTPGGSSLLLLDPAGNWIEIIEMAQIG